MPANIYRRHTESRRLALLRLNYLLLQVSAAFNAAPILVRLIARNQMAEAANPAAHAHWRWLRDSATLFLIMRAFSIILLWLSPAGSVHGALPGLLAASLRFVYRAVKGGLRLRMRQAPHGASA